MNLTSVRHLLNLHLAHQRPQNDVQYVEQPALAAIQKEAPPKISGAGWRDQARFRNSPGVFDAVNPGKMALSEVVPMPARLLSSSLSTLR